MTRYVSKIRWVSQNTSRMGGNNLMHDWRGRIEDVIHDVYTTGYTRGKASVGTDCEERPQWIPCSERLPKDCEIVLASFKTGVVQMCKYFDSGRDDSWWSYKDDCFAWDNTVVAWMPIPTPYEEEGEQNERID